MRMDVFLAVSARIALKQVLDAVYEANETSIMVVSTTQSFSATIRLGMLA
jgi:hypothetical protein